MDRKGSFGGITFCYRQSLSKYLIVFDDFCENVFWVKDHSFSIWVFCHEHSRTTGLQGKGGGGISWTPHYHFHPLHNHLDISRAITADSSPLHIASNRTRTGNLLSVSRLPLSYAPYGSSHGSSWSKNN